MKQFIAALVLLISMNVNAQTQDPLPTVFTVRSIEQRIASLVSQGKTVHEIAIEIARYYHTRTIETRYDIGTDTTDLMMTARRADGSIYYMIILATFKGQ